MPIAYIGIGSNLGNREENCEKAIALLIKEGMEVFKRSSFYETEPWGLKDQPEFINMALEIKTKNTPLELLDILKKIETTLGRMKDERWGPRIIDLDILFYDDLILKTHGLEIPHPLIQDRGFVLKPLSEIAPEKMHPVLKKSVKALLLELMQDT